MIQLCYGEDNLDAIHVEFQSIPNLKPSHKVFEKKFKFDATNERQMRKCMSEDVVREVLGDAHIISELESEWDQLKVDRDQARKIFPTGDARVRCHCLSVSLSESLRCRLMQLSTWGTDPSSGLDAK
jgi:DNA-directed RNA polymerase II subunit RPB1